MSTTYTGVGGNVSQSTSPTITVPADGDSLAVTSVNVAMDKLMDYIALLFGGAQTGQTSTTPGYAGTGGASAQGGKFTAGGTSSPVKGMVNLVPTTNAPSSPDNGDLWATTAGILGARLNSLTRTIALLEAAQTWSALQTFGSNLSAINAAKAWAFVTCGAAGAVTVTNAFNVASASYSGSLLTINYTNALSNSTYAVSANILTGTSGVGTQVTSLGTTSCVIGGVITNTPGTRNFANLDQVMVIVFGT